MEFIEVTVINKSFSILHCCKVLLTKSPYEKLGKEKTIRETVIGKG